MLAQIKIELNKMRQNFNYNNSFPETFARFVNSFRWRSEYLRNSQCHFTPNTLKDKNGKILQQFYDRVIKRLENTENSLIHSISDASLKQYVYYYKGDPIAKCVYEAVAPIYDLFISTTRTPMQQTLCTYPQCKIEIPIHAVSERKYMEFQIKH